MKDEVLFSFFILCLLRGNEEWGTGNREWGMGNGEQGIGNGEQGDGD
jgi:hypothetical protein